MFKYKLSTLLIFLIMLCTVTFVKAKNFEFALLGKTIYIDPGHGGIDSGATYKNIKESEINLKISLKLKDNLEKYGAVVYLTRTGNYDLSQINSENKKRSDLKARAKLINESKSDLFISIHLNSDPSPTWYGSQTFYTKTNKQNKALAETIQEILKQELKTPREAKEIKNIYLFDQIKIPGALVEIGFLSNPSERKKLQDDEYQNQITNLITEGIIKYVNKN